MATDHTLEALRAKQREQGISLRAMATALGVTQPYMSMLFAGKRSMTRETERKINRYLRPKPSVTLSAALDSFIGSNVHKSHKTVETLRERLTPFVEYMTDRGVDGPLDITRDHIDGFLREIGRGRRGRPLSPTSLFGFTKDVRALVNFIAETVAPEEWRNPASKLQCKHPQVTIRPLSQGHVDTLLAIVDSLDVTPILKARHKATIYVLLDGALRISELMNALKQHLNGDGILTVYGKGAKEREVALSGRTVAAIQEYFALRDDRSPFLFVTEEGKQLTYEGVKSLFHRWRKTAPTAFQGVRLSAHIRRGGLADVPGPSVTCPPPCVGSQACQRGTCRRSWAHSSPVMTRHYSQFALARTANAAAVRTSPVEALFRSADKDGDRAV